MTNGHGPIRIVEKLWGREEILVDEPGHCLKRLVIKPRAMCSLHYHRVKQENFVVEKGRPLIQVGIWSDLPLFTSNVGDWKAIPVGIAHRFMNLHPEDECVILESSTHDDPTDVVRIEDSQELGRME